METVAYARRFRRVGVVSAVAGPGLVVAMVAGGIVPSVWYLPGIALAIAAIPLMIFVSRHRPVCEKCTGAMRISSGFPFLVYRCRRCGDVVHTGLHADY